MTFEWVREPKWIQGKVYLKASFAEMLPGYCRISVAYPEAIKDGRAFSLHDGILETNDRTWYSSQPIEPPEVIQTHYKPIDEDTDFRILPVRPSCSCG